MNNARDTGKKKKNENANAAMKHISKHVLRKFSKFNLSYSSVFQKANTNSFRI